MGKYTETITLTASIDCGEGGLTERSRALITELSDMHGPLWAVDVLGDWKADLDYYYAEAEIRYLATHTHAREDMALTPAEFWKEVWRKDQIDAVSASSDYYYFSAACVPETFCDEVIAIDIDVEKCEALKEEALTEDVERIVETVIKEEAAKAAGEVADCDRFPLSYQNQIHRRVALEMYKRGLAAGQSMAAAS